MLMAAPLNEEAKQNDGSLVKEGLGFLWSLWILKYLWAIQAEMLRGYLLLKLRGENNLTNDATNLFKSLPCVGLSLETGDR